MEEENSRVVMVEKMTKVNLVDQGKHINYFSRCPLGIRLEIFEQQKGIFHRLRETYKAEANVSDISYCSLILAIGLIRAKEKALLTKSFGEMTLDEIRDISTFQVKKFAEKVEKHAHKRETLIGYWSLVRQLRNEHNLSFIKISLFLLKKRKFKISASYIYECWKELETLQSNTTEDVK